MIYLRPHHINCLFFYIGKGYNEDFVRNMDKIYDKLKTNRNTEIKFTICDDDICKHCPNLLKNKKCLSEKHINELDILSIKYFEFDINKIYTFEDIIKNIYKNYNSEIFEKICSSCEWYKKGVCCVNKIEIQKNKFFSN